MKRLSEAQRRVMTLLTSGHGYHLRWEEPHAHLRVYSEGGLRIAPDRIYRQTTSALWRDGLLEHGGRLPNGSVTWVASPKAWALAHKGQLR